MDISNTLFVKNREEWRKWLEEHYKTEKDIWLGFYKKHVKKVGMSYEGAVEEALCFGWIDSMIKRIDDEQYVLRFSPRQTKSHFTEANKEKLRMLLLKGKVTKEVEEQIKGIL